MVQEVVCMLSAARQLEIKFLDGRPTRSWIPGFVKRHPGFVLRNPQSTEDVRVNSLTTDIVCMHVARMIAVAGRYRIVSPHQAYNLDESGI